MLEMLSAVGAGAGGDLLAVDAQREIHLVEKTSDRVGRNGTVDLLENLGDVLRRLAGRLQPGDGSAAAIVFQEDLDGIDYFGRFFHELASGAGLVERVGQLAVATTAHLEGLQPRVEAALL